MLCPLRRDARPMLSSLPLVALLLQSSAQKPEPAIGENRGWSALPTPLLAEPRSSEVLPSTLPNGLHLLHPREASPTAGQPPAPRVPISVLQRILEDAPPGGRAGRIELFKSSGSLLARGDPAALDAARQRIAELDRAAEALAIDLEMDLAGSGGGAAAAPEHLSEKRRVASGDETFFGERRTTGFVMSFDVEVAADSGIASPVIGSAVQGKTLHLRAVRVDGGKRVYLQGILDLSELASLDRFDPETPDLGVIQEPAVDYVQIAFAGVVDSGGVMRIDVSGTPLARPDWKLSVRAAARPDAAGAKDAALDVIDLAFLASDPGSLPPASPGAELDRQVLLSPPSRSPTPIPAAAIAAALDAHGSSESSGGRGSAWWSDDLLILRQSDAAARAEARSLVAAGEAARLVSCRIEARQGAFTASFPACAGAPARLLAGRERTALVGYKVEIAPQTWMGAPDVQRTFDGLALEARVVPGAAECSLWTSKSAPAVVASRADSQLGRLQVLSRSLRTQRARIQAGASESDAPPRGAQGGTEDLVVLRCLAP
jgi:hypothetical protein